MELEDKRKDETTLNKNDWVEVERRGNWHKSYQTNFFRNYLNVTGGENLKFDSVTAAPAAALATRFILEDFLKKEKFKVEKVVYIGETDDHAPIFTNIDYEQDKSKRCMINGQFLLSKNKEKFILSVESYPQQYVGFMFISPKDSKLSGKEFISSLSNYADKHNYLKGKKIDGDLNLIHLGHKYRWDELVLDKYTNKELQTNLKNLIDNVEIYEKNDLPLKRGLIISGEPGTGKSLLGKILCNNIKWTFMWITPKNFHCVESVACIMKTARMLGPTILFLEDIDLYGKHRDQNALTSLLGELMNQLDGLEDNNYVVSIATTNNQDSLEKALLNRPGRFDKVIKFNTPTSKCRDLMFKTFLGKLDISEDVDMEELVDRTDRMTGAQIKEVVNQAVLQAIDTGSYDKDKILHLKKVHFESALLSARRKDFHAPLGFTEAKPTAVAEQPIGPEDFDNNITENPPMQR